LLCVGGVGREAYRMRKQYGLGLRVEGQDFRVEGLGLLFKG